VRAVVPEFAELQRIGLDTLRIGALENLGDIAGEPLLQPLVGVRAEEPFGAMLASRLDERHVVAAFAPWLPHGIADELGHLRVPGQDLRSGILGAVVQRDDTIDRRSDVLEPAGQETLFVAGLEKSDEPHQSTFALRRRSSIAFSTGA
jgi:hypothetical protein